MRLLVLFCFLPLVLGGAIPGQEKCVWGPPYWCSHVTHARECGATTHCLQTVWKNQIIKPKSTTTCTYCELIVNEFRDALQDKTTEDDIANILTNVCAILPGDYLDMCKGIITDYAPELLEMFAKDISTDMICATIGLCSGLEDTWSPYGVKANNETVCADCTKFFKDVQESITSNETVNQLTQLINQTVCSLLGGFSELCMEFVEQYLPLGLQMLADQIDPDIVCRVFGFCSAEGPNAEVLKIKNIFQGRQSVGPLEYRSSEECDLCKDFFSQIVAMIKDKDNQDKVIAELKTVVCDELGTFADQCKELVDEYAPMLFELLVNELDPTTLCEAVGVCQTPSLSQEILKAEEQPASMVGPGYVKTSVECDACKILMSEIDSFIKENGTVKKIEDLIDKVCEKLPSEDLKKQCLAFVKEYGPLVVNLTAQELDPKVFCGKIGLCNDTVKETKVADSTCDMCTLFVNGIKSALENVSSQVLMNDLKAICAFVPGNYSTLCLKYVNTYAPLVIDLLKTTDAKKICEMATLCTSSLTPYMTKPIPEKIVSSGPSIECEVCGTVIIAVKKLLSSNASEADVKAALEKVCTMIPSVLQSECDDLVKKYGDQLIQMLVKDLDANTICKELGLCKEASRKQESAIMSAIMSPYNTLPLFVPVENKKAPGGPSEACEICDTFIIFLKEYLSNKDTEGEVKQLLKDLCAYLPSTITSTCETLVDNYGDNFIQVLLKYLDANTICSDLGLCEALEKSSTSVSTALMSPYDILHSFKPLENKKGDEGGSEECVVCKSVMNFLDKELQQNRTKELIKAALDDVCSELGDLKTECTELVDTYSDVIINYLILSESPDMICKTIGLCSARTENLPEPVHVKLLKDNSETVPVKAGILCDVCQLAMKEVDKILMENRSQAAIEAALDKVCSLLPDTLSNECDDFVKQYGPAIIQLIVNNANPNEVCSKLGLCSQRYSEIKEETVPVKAGILCDVCQLAMKEVDNILMENRSQAAIEAALDKVCSLLPDTLSNECDDFVKQYGPDIIQLIVNNANPNEVCSKLGLCAQRHSEIKEETVPVKAGILCDVCQLAMKEVDNILMENRSQAAIEAALDKVCSLLPDTLSNECDDFVKQYGPAIIQLIVNNANPNEVCSKLGLCSQRHSEIKEETVPVKAGILCDVCQLAMKEVDKILMENRSQAAIEAALDKVCSLLPDTLSNECDDFVKQYGPAIIQLIVNNADPNEVCSKLGLCAQRHSEIKEDTKPVKAGALCEICKLVIEEVDKLLKGNRSEDAIRKALDEVCSVLPNTISTECTEIVNKYTKMIVNLLVNNIEPAEICKILTLCAAKQSQPFGAFVKILTEMPKAGMDECVLCEVIVNVVQLELKENSTKQYIDQYMESFCTYLPDTVSDQCDVFVDKYVDEAIKKFAQGYTPQQICQDLKKCSKFDDKTDDDTLYFKPHHKLVGGKKCTYGPAYWCASKENAAECHAVEHCTRHVWN